MHIPWEDIQLLLAIADTGSLSSAAKRLRVAQPTVSRRLADLEARLKEPLFSRSVEGTAPTAFGESLLAPARRMAEWGAEVDRAVDRAESSPKGVVRVTAPPGVAFDLLAPFARHVREKLPEVRLEVVSTVQYLDLARREADLALRLQRPGSRDLACLASREADVRLFASPSYARSLPRGYTLADIGYIVWAPPYEHLPPNPQLAEQLPGFRATFSSDDYLVQLRAAHEGLGAVFLGRVRFEHAPPSSLVELDVDIGPLKSWVHLVAARSALEIPRVRAVAELLTREIERADTRRAR